MINSELFNNITYIEENNFNVVGDDVDIWNGALPFSEGMEFPTLAIKERAEISKTNLMIYDNKVKEIFNEIISIFPEIDPMYGWQIREIITSLPFFKNATNAWIGLIASDLPLISVDDDDDDTDIKMSSVIDNSNIGTMFQDEIKSRFLDVISAYRVDVDLKGKPTIIKIDTKNLIVYMNKESINSIEVVVVFSIYEDDGVEYVDFVSYYYNGRIVKDTFYYSDGTIGAHVKQEEDKAFNGLFDESPIVVFKHNVNGNGVYGTDQYRYWIPSMLAGMRELQNILRLGERTREMIRQVPDSAIHKSDVDGSSMFINRGTVPYNDANDRSAPGINYETPEIRMEEAIKAFNISINQIGMDTGLGAAFYNLSNLGSKLSSESIKAALFPCRLEAKRITSEIRDSFKELVVKLCYLGGLDLRNSKLSLTFYDGFPKDEYRDIEAIQKRLESKTPSISVVDAIQKLDRVPIRIAKLKMNEINEQLKNLGDEVVLEEVPDETVSDYDNIDTEVDLNLLNNLNNLKPGVGDDIKKRESIIRNDDTIWGNQMFPKPRDTQKNREEARRFWILKKLHTKTKI